MYLIILQSMRCLLLVGPHMVLPQEGVPATGGNLCTVGPRGDPEEGEDQEKIEGKEMKNGVGDRREGRKEGHDYVHIHHAFLLFAEVEVVPFPLLLHLKLKPLGQTINGEMALYRKTIITGNLGIYYNNYVILTLF